MDLFRARNVAVGAAYRGGAVLRKHLGNLRNPRKKSDIDLVSDADLESEAVIIECIHEAFPGHAVMAEESGGDGSDSEFRWIIDPLDGTTNFFHQLGLFCVSIGFEYQGDVVVGAVLNPVSGELFTAVSGHGAELNGEPIRVSPTRNLLESLLVTGFPYNVKEIYHPVMDRMGRCLKAAQGIRRLGSAALDLCYVACGRFDGFWEQNLKPWDVAAGWIIAREAGAMVTDFANAPFALECPELLATNGNIHEAMLDVLKLREDDEKESENSIR